MKIFLVIAEKEDFYQDKIDGPFVAHKNKDVVKAFRSKNKAESFVDKMKLKKPERVRYGGWVYFKGGYCDMKVEEIEVE